MMPLKLQRSAQGVFIDRLGCFVDRIEYDFRERVGLLYMQDLSCCDWVAVVLMFESIDPDVGMIQTFAGQDFDAMWMKSSDGGWTRLHPEQHRDYLRSKTGQR